MNLHYLGPRTLTDGQVEFRVWAPRCQQLALVVEGREAAEPMVADAQGVFSVIAPVGDGARYQFRLPSGILRPDPASRFQPDGVHGPSQYVDTTSFLWTDSTWRGVPASALVLYELHLGAFTAAGTYLAAIQRLDELVELGVTAVELLPLHQSAGARNWGYDGVNLYAPRHSFGTPRELARFVDAAHARGIAVILDVVYNHFGPEGNYLHEFGPYVSSRHGSAWGDTPNFDEEGSQPLRDFIVGNALYWLAEYHFDGLRLDATHCIIDHSKTHIVRDLGAAVARFAEQSGRTLHLIAESNIYDPELLTPVSQGGYGCTAEWCDDLGHAVYANLRPGEQLSNRQYEAHADLDLVLRRGFAFQGGLFQERRRVSIDAAPPVLPRHQLVYSIQNHDFIGNHPQGKRLHQVASPDAHRAAAALLLMCPAIPMLFMGEEFASPHPFLFFADFDDPQIRRAVEEGRRREYPQHDWSEVESPLDEAAFTRSYIGDRADGDPATWECYRKLIQLRREFLAAKLLPVEIPEQFTAAWHAEQHLAHLTFRASHQEAFAIVRLHGATDEAHAVQLQLDGKVCLQQNCTAEPIPGLLTLGRNAFIIGWGRTKVIHGKPVVTALTS